MKKNNEKRKKAVFVCMFTVLTTVHKIIWGITEAREKNV